MTAEKPTGVTDHQPPDQNGFDIASLAQRLGKTEEWGQRKRQGYPRGKTLDIITTEVHHTREESKAGNELEWRFRTSHEEWYRGSLENQKKLTQGQQTREPWFATTTHKGKQKERNSSPTERKKNKGGAMQKRKYQRGRRVRGHRKGAERGH